MTIKDLQKLFNDSLPQTFINEIGDKEFNTCWYGCSALDPRPMEVLDYSHPDAITKEKVDVFFYTDIDFFSIKNCGFYHSHSRGRVLFNRNCIQNFEGEDTHHNPWGYRLLKQKFSCHGISINIGDLDPNDIGKNFIPDKIDLKNQFEELYKIWNEVSPESREDWDWFLETQDDNELSSVCARLGINPKEDMDVIIKFLELKWRAKNKEKNHEDYSSYDFCTSLVMHTRNNDEPFYTFYLDIDNDSFEKLLIQNKLKIDYAARHNKGWGVVGMDKLGDIGCRYSLGAGKKNMSNCLNYKLETTGKKFVWSPHYENDLCELERVVIY